MASDTAPLLSSQNAQSLISSRAISAIRSASAQSGVSFDYLLETAKRESSLNPVAQAKTSSAAGLFQFIEQTWLGAVKQYGDKYGLSNQADAITQNTSGKYEIANPALRKRILDLRFDPIHSANLAGELAAKNKAALAQGEPEAVSNGALYAAHFLGLGGAIKLLNAPTNQIGATLFPQAAHANQSIFYDKNRPRTVGEIISSFEKSFASTTQTPAPITSASTRPSPSNIAALSLHNVNDTDTEPRRSDNSQTILRRTIPSPTTPESHQNIPVARTFGRNINTTPTSNLIPDTIWNTISPISMQALLSLDPAILLTPFARTQDTERR